jgi:CheY-like chemotaxis protein/two-component sensor histidine kinase
MLAHELRNPLGALSNALQVLRSARSEEPVWRRALDVAERQVNHQARLVTDLLDVSRLMHDRIETHRQRLDLAALVREAAEDCRSLIREAGLTLALELPPGPVWVEGDPTQLAQVLTNLLNNATKFTDPGGRVTLSLAPDAGPDRVAVRVTDTGIGISPEMLPHVWEVFSQADRSLDRSRGGLGLGLALVRGLVELHGGEVRAESPGLGCGSTFTALLPLAESPEDETDTQPGLRILLVEDNRDAAETLRDLLELSGHRVELAFSGPAALEAAPRFQPEVVLCDIGLPGMDGYAVARQLRSDGATALAPGARLVALTGYGREEDRRRTSEAGFDLHLVKPVKPGELQRLLETWAAERLPPRREGERKR